MRELNKKAKAEAKRERRNKRKQVEGMDSSGGSVGSEEPSAEIAIDAPDKATEKALDATD